MDTDDEVEVTDFHKVNENNFQQIENKANKVKNINNYRVVCK